MIHAFISSKLVYCNSLYIGMSQSNISRHQMDQNAAARLLSGTWKFDHISPILQSLHWLPICYRIDFKTLLIVFKALNGLAPKYLSNLLNLNNSARLLSRGETKLFLLLVQNCGIFFLFIRLISTESVLSS